MPLALTKAVDENSSEIEWTHCRQYSGNKQKIQIVLESRSYPRFYTSKAYQALKQYAGMLEIARIADVAEGTVYEDFGSKQNLLVSIPRQKLAGLYSRASDASFEKRIRAIAVQQFRFLLQRKGPFHRSAAAAPNQQGIPLVENPAGLEQAVRLAKAEALRAFGCDRVYAERYLRQPRHIEVQVLADHHGAVVHLGERACSIQRRFQKVIEESPAPGLPDDLRRRLCARAVEIARCAQYRNAG